MTTPTIAKLFDLSGKGAMVIGGSKGIGQAISLRLAEAGAGVTVTGRDVEAMQDTVEQIRALGGEVQAVRADASDLADVNRVIKAQIETFGRLDILIYNAGIFPIAPSLEMTEEQWDVVHNTNLKSAFFYSQAAAREMIRAGHGGKIVHIASVDALRPSGQMVHYGASKGGVISLTKALALEFGPHGIMVNAVAPYGIIGTPGGTKMQADAGVPTDDKDLAELMSKFLERFPLRRTGEPDDIARVVLFLATPASDYLTGSLIVADGGNLLT
ncbi:MAG: SDR family oxidoreductase [Chloroflexi bacterium]|nr:SDR family oxidoreductase [Chloroflexota bacterium]